MDSKTTLTPLAIIIGAIIIGGSYIYVNIYGERYMRVSDGVIVDKVTGDLAVIAPTDEKIDFTVGFHTVGKVASNPLGRIFAKANGQPQHMPAAKE